MMAFWLERLVGLGEGTRILFLFKNSMIVRQCLLKIFIIHRVSSLALVDQPLTIRKVSCASC